jgi:hypothetical protein
MDRMAGQPKQQEQVAVTVPAIQKSNLPFERFDQRE